MEWQGELLDVLDVVDDDVYQMNDETIQKAIPTMKMTC